MLQSHVDTRDSHDPRACLRVCDRSPQQSGFKVSTSAASGSDCGGLTLEGLQEQLVVGLKQLHAGLPGSSRHGGGLLAEPVGFSSSGEPPRVAPRRALLLVWSHLRAAQREADPQPPKQGESEANDRNRAALPLSKQKGSSLLLENPAASLGSLPHLTAGTGPLAPPMAARAEAAARRVSLVEPVSRLRIL